MLKPNHKQVSVQNAKHCLEARPITALEWDLKSTFLIQKKAMINQEENFLESLLAGDFAVVFTASLLDFEYFQMDSS